MEEEAQNAADGTCRVLVLGSGTSTGVPIIGCACPVCTSADPRDNRMRFGLHLTFKGFHLQIDTSPDFRNQALRFRLPRMDAVLLSHCHADHVLGLDELRRYNQLQQESIPLYCLAPVAREINRIFGYIFNPPPLPPDVRVFRPRLTLRVVEERQATAIGPFRVEMSTVPHGPVQSTAFRIEADGRRLVVATDVSAVTPGLLEWMRDADLVLLDGLRPSVHSAHLSQGMCHTILRTCGCKRGRLLHIGHNVLHEDLLTSYPPPFSPTYDGEELVL